ncbi:MAG: potassium channel family protein [Actinomycetota bacterium]
MPDEDQPRNVKELLVEAKDVSELMIDLAYAAVFFNDGDLAEEVEELEDRMDGYLRRLREISMLAARSPEDAEAMAGVLHIAGAMEKIGDAASDIARVVQAKLGIPGALRPDLRHADEIVGRVKVREGAPCVGRSLRELLLPSETGMWLLAIRRGTEWEFDPQADSVLSEGDMLLFQGPEEGVNLIREVAGAPPLPEPAETEGGLPLSELDRAVDILVEMKNAAEVAVGLAYSALLFKDPALAAEVATLEARSDILHDELESWVLKAAPEARNTDELRGLLRLGYASETIFDAARDMTWLIEHDEELHPVIQMALEETEEIAVETVVEPGSRAEGRSLKQLQLETETGMFVLAVQRGRRWMYRPRPRFELEAGDRVISIGPEEGAPELDALARGYAAVVESGP